MSDSMSDGEAHYNQARAGACLPSEQAGTKPKRNGMPRIAIAAQWGDCGMERSCRTMRNTRDSLSICLGAIARLDTQSERRYTYRRTHGDRRARPLVARDDQDDDRGIGRCSRPSTPNDPSSQLAPNCQGNNRRCQHRTGRLRFHVAQNCNCQRNARSTKSMPKTKSTTFHCDLSLLQVPSSEPVAILRDWWQPSGRSTCQLPPRNNRHCSTDYHNTLRAPPIPFRPCSASRTRHVSRQYDEWELKERRFPFDQIRRFKIKRMARSRKEPSNRRNDDSQKFQTTSNGSEVGECLTSKPH